MFTLSQYYFIRIYEERFCRVEVKSFDIEIDDIIIEAVVLFWVDRIEFVYLNEMQVSQRSSPVKEQSVLFTNLLRASVFSQFFRRYWVHLMKYSGVLPVGRLITPFGLSATHSRNLSEVSNPRLENYLQQYTATLSLSESFPNP